LEKVRVEERESREGAAEPLEMTTDSLVEAACDEKEASVEALRSRVLAGLCWLGFRREEAKRALALISDGEGVEELMRSALMTLTSRGVAAA
jgi:Holliday junction resolvasome RuvABC DNA-binding subunit